MKEINLNFVLEVLNNNGIDEEYFDSMGGREVEFGCDEWLDVVCEIVDKDISEIDNLSVEDSKLVKKFIRVMEDNGIEFV